MISRAGASAAGASFEGRASGTAAVGLGGDLLTALLADGRGADRRSDTSERSRLWALRFNAHGAAGLIDIKAPGPTPKLNDAQRFALKEIVESGPIPAIHGVVRWRLVDLVQWLDEEFAVSLDETTVGRELKAMGFRKLSARPRHHAQNEFAVEAFKKTSRPKSKRSVSVSNRE